MTVSLGWVCAAVAVLATFAAAYFFDRSADERIAKLQNEKQQEVAQSQSGAESLRLKNLELEFKLEQARNEAQRLQSRYASRHLSTFQWNVIVSELKAVGRQTLEIVEFSDREAANYAKEIASVFRDAGWNVKVISVGAMATPIFGIQVSSVDPSISEALSKADVAHDVISADPQPRILVGLKPTY